MNTLATPQTATTTWNVDPAHTAVEFKVKHMMISNVKGQFTDVQGTLVLDEADLANSHIETSIDAASVNTREPQRDACTDHDTTRPPAGERPGSQYPAATMNWDLRYRKSSLVIRLLLAVWITAVVIVLCATGRWWGLAFVAPLVLDLYLLRRILAAGSGR